MAALTQKQKIINLRRKGWSYNRIQQKLDTSQAYIYRCLEAAGMTQRRSSGRGRRKHGSRSRR